MNDHILPPGVKIVPFIDRSDLVHFTTSHRAAQPDGRNDPGLDHPVSISRQCSGCAHRGGDDSVFPAVCLDLSGPEAHSREPAVAGSAGFWHGGRWRGGDDRKHRPPLGPHERDANANAKESARPRTKSSARCSTRSLSSSPRTCPSSRCSASKAACSIPWPGRSPLRCSGR